MAEFQAWDACKHYLPETQLPFVYAITAFGTRARLWRYDLSSPPSSVLSPMFGCVYHSSRFKDYIDVHSTDAQQLTIAFDVMLSNSPLKPKFNLREPSPQCYQIMPDHSMLSLWKDAPATVDLDRASQTFWFRLLGAIFSGEDGVPSTIDSTTRLGIIVKYVNEKIDTCVLCFIEKKSPDFSAAWRAWVEKAEHQVVAYGKSIDASKRHLSSLYRYKPPFIYVMVVTGTHARVSKHSSEIFFPPLIETKSLRSIGARESKNLNIDSEFTKAILSNSRPDLECIPASMDPPSFLLTDKNEVQSFSHMKDGEKIYSWNQPGEGRILESETPSQWKLVHIQVGRLRLPCFQSLKYKVWSQFCDQED